MRVVSPYVRIAHLALLVGVVLLGGASCNSSSNPLTQNKNDLAKMETATIRVKNIDFTVWLALSNREQELGLMQTTTEELAPVDGKQRGMLFVFQAEQILSFWMFNTIIPLDIVYIRADGEIVSKYTMAPLETRLYPSIEPALYALEMRAGLLDELGIGVGDRVEIPESVLKSFP